jgi:hypothetical protein
MSEVGSVAEEAARLLEAVQEWVRGHPGHVDENGEPLTCRLCPFCRLLALARGAQPETFEHLIAAADSLASAARSVVDGHSTGRASGVQHIDIG